MNKDGFKHIIDLQNEAEGAILQGILEEEEIPHRLIRNYDNVYAGIFIPQYGWGYVEAPEEYRDQIVDIYLDLRESRLKAEEPGDDEADER